MQPLGVFDARLARRPLNHQAKVTQARPLFLQSACLCSPALSYAVYLFIGKEKIGSGKYQ